MNDCVTAAASGDTINVPAGTASWASPIALPGAKDLTIAGATTITCTGGSSATNPVSCSAANNTSITCSGGECFTLNLSASHRITGFTMLQANNGGIGTIGNPSLATHFRIDHNRIVSSAGWAPLEVQGGSNGVHPQGLVDHNIFVDIAIHSNGTNHQWDDPCSTCQDQIWAQQTPLGDSSAIVYIEANYFQNTAANVNSTDSNYGGRYVFRFNNIVSGRHTVEVHGVQGENRGSQRTEVYHNASSGLTGFSGTSFFRGGSGVLFGNRQSSAFSFGILFTNDRSELDGAIAVVGSCDGTHTGLDQNTAGQRGWHCRDQVGISRDTVLWQHSPSFGAWNQVIAPVYVWNNLTGASQMGVEVDTIGDADLHIQFNRDFYNYDASFNGTTGVGVGPIGSRPSTCTTGVAYWATDEGEWNSLNAGKDGRLYKCTAANTWTLYYTPYQYPHPWTGASTPPAPPTNLRIIAAFLLGMPGIIGACLVHRRRAASSLHLATRAD